MRWSSFLLALSLFSGLWAGEPIRFAVKEWTTLNPLLMTRNTDPEAVDLLFDRLVTINAKGEFIPELLESWTILKDGQEVVLKLRPGLVWQDGNPIDAEDLVFTWKAMRHPLVMETASMAGGVPSMDSVTAEGPLTVRIRLKRPRGTLMADLYAFIPVPRRHYQVGSRPREAAVNFAPVGSGPYRVVGKATSHRVFMERWEGYRGPHPGSSAAVEQIDANGIAADLPAFEAERLHYAGVDPLTYYLVRKGARGKGLVQAVSLPLASFEAFFLNCDSRRSLLGDLAVRKAIAELVPWQHLARARRFFPSRLATSFWPPESWAYNPTPRPLPQVANAAAILEASGWKLGPDGIRRDAKGRPLSLIVHDGASSPKDSQARRMVDLAAQAGIRLDLRPGSLRDVFEKATRHDGDLWAFGWTLSLDPDVDSPLFTREGFLTKANVSGFLNPEIDRKFDEGRHAVDPEARKRIYQEIAELIYQFKPVIPINYRQTRVLIHRRLHGVAFDGLGQSYGFWPGRRGWTLGD